MQNNPSTQANLTQALNLIKAQLSEKFSSLTMEKENSLKALYEALCRKANNEPVDLNEKVTVQWVLAVQRTKDFSLLNIAANYCKAEVVSYLLNNGAKADNKTIHYATKYNPDMENVVKVLNDHHVNLNALNKKGETALYVATRRHKDNAVAALRHNHASMLLFERVKAPVLNEIDDIKNRVEDVALAIFYPGFHGC